MLGRRRTMMASQAEGEKEVREWKVLQEMTTIGEDKKSISFEIPSAKEVFVVFNGRSNDEDDTLANANDNGSVYINGSRISSGALLTYIRKSGTSFYTIMNFRAVCGFIDGSVSCKGGSAICGGPAGSIIKGESIRSFSMVTNNYFKADSEVAVFYR